MTIEELKRELVNRLGVLDEKVKIYRSRRISCEVEYAKFAEAMKIITKDLGFSMLPAITGLDQKEKLCAMYHLAKDDGVVLNLKTCVDKNNPVLRSVTPQFPSAEVYERELVDLFGFKVEGLPQGPRYPLTDDWPKGEYPLRKDWKQKK